MPSASPYRVSNVPKVATQFARLKQRAIELAILPDFSRARKEILAHLQTDPLTWGEPLYNTAHPGGVRCVAVSPPLFVSYVVFENERTVLWLELEPLSRSPLAGDENSDAG
jgi:hypothetical protein